MPLCPRRLCTAAIGILLFAQRPAPAAAQSTTVPLIPDAWSATDSVRFLLYQGQPAIYVRRGIALVRGAAMENGTLDLDVAATDTTNFLGVSFRAAGPKFSNVVFLRPGASGTIEAVQYGPAFNTLGVAWQVYHGDGANAVATIPRNRWVHLRLELDGAVARVFVDTASAPTLVIPRVVTSGGAGLGLWTGPFGRGAYFANIRFTAMSGSAESPAPALPAGTIRDWQLSSTIDAVDFTPALLPDLNKLKWDPVMPEPEGFVLVNRYREAPVGGTPRDSEGAVLVDSVMTGKMAGSRIVYARTTITAPRDELRRLEYSYNNGVVIYLNGRPLVLAMNPSGLRSELGIMAHAGDAVYLPLKHGKNELVFAVITATGGWAYSARLDAGVAR